MLRRIHASLGKHKALQEPIEDRLSSALKRPPHHRGGARKLGRDALGRKYYERGAAVSARFRDRDIPLISMGRLGDSVGATLC